MMAPDRTIKIGPVPEYLLDSPIEFLIADHVRQRTVFDLIEQLARSAVLDRDLTAEVLRFLENDMVAHVTDEEVGLFPLLRRRCEPEDEIEQVLENLSAEHAAEERVAVEIRAGLAEALETDCRIADIIGLEERMLGFAAAEQRHLALEYAIVLPIARARLSEDDLRDLGARMIARRAQK